MLTIPPPPTSRQLPTPLDWVNKGFAICQTVSSGHIKDPVPLIDKSRALFPGGRVPPSFIHQVIFITGLNKLWLLLYVLVLKMAVCQGVKPPLKLKTITENRYQIKDTTDSVSLIYQPTCVSSSYIRRCLWLTLYVGEGCPAGDGVRTEASSRRCLPPSPK